MRLYVINDLNDRDVARIESALTERGMAASMDQLYWVDIPKELLTKEQQSHMKDCGPYSMGLEVIGEIDFEGRTPGSSGPMIALELLVRARNKLRCSCIGYATPDQRRFAIDFLDKLLRQLDIQP